MKPKLTAFILSLTVLAGASFAALPKDPVGILTVRIGQLLEKSGYKDLKMWELIPQDERDEIPKELFEIMKDPARTGLDFDQPMHFFGNLVTDLPLPKKMKIDEPVFIAGCTFKVRDGKQLTKLMDVLAKGMKDEYDEKDRNEGAKGLLQKEKIDGATVYFDKAEPSFVVVHKGTELVALGSNYSDVLEGIKGKKRREKLPKPAQWIREQALPLTVPSKEAETDAVLKQHFSKKDDIAFYFDYKQFSSTFGDLAKMMEENEELDSFLKMVESPALKKYMDTKITAGINFGKGSINASTRYFMDNKAYTDMLGDGVSPKLLNALPSKPTFLMGSSLNMKAARKSISEIYLPFIREAMEDEDFGMDNPLPIVGASINELMAIPGGDFVLYLRDVVKAPGPLPMPQAEFIVGMSLNNRGMFDKILDKLTTPKDPKEKKMNIEQTLGFLGISMVRKDDAIFLCHTKFVREVQSGKSLDPIEKKHRDKLASSTAHYFLDFPRLAKLAETWVPPKQKDQDGMKQVLDFLKSMDHMEMNQQKDMTSTMTLSFKDKEQNSLRTFGEFIKKLAVAELNKGDEPEEKDDEPKEKKDKKDKPVTPRQKKALLPEPPPPAQGSIPYQIPSSKEINLESAEDFQKFLATFRGKVSEKEKLLVGRWTGENDTSEKNEWEILQRADRSFTMVIKSKDEMWEERPVLHGAWRVDSKKLLYVVLQVENFHLPFSDLKIQDEDVKTLEKNSFVTIGEEDDGNSFNSTQTRTKRFQSPRMWLYNNPESLDNFTFHIPPEPGR
ncbi:MAG: DUF4836 family protein [Opitutae bacterium]|nr:DUF4836 family protein [Opitutae bacterium]